MNNFKVGDRVTVNRAKLEIGAYLTDEAGTVVGVVDIDKSMVWVIFQKDDMWRDYFESELLPAVNIEGFEI